MDLVFLATGTLMFVLMWGLVIGCDQLGAKP